MSDVELVKGERKTQQESRKRKYAVPDCLFPPVLLELARECDIEASDIDPLRVTRDVKLVV